MGGRSSSSSTSQNITTTSDERIAATDNAMVTRISGSNNTLTDHGAVEAAGELTLEVINNLSHLAQQSLNQTKTAIDVLGESTDNAYQFINAETGNDQNQTLTKVLPWLVAGVSVIAITKAKFK